MRRVRRLFPDPAELSVSEALDGFRPQARAGDRPHVTLNMVASIDGRAALRGRSRSASATVPKAAREPVGAAGRW